MKRYAKPDDDNILLEIKEVIKQRPSYGYKRVTAMINKDRCKQGLPTYNRKRICRIMDMNGLIFKKSNPLRDHK